MRKYQKYWQPRQGRSVNVKGLNIAVHGAGFLGPLTITAEYFIECGFHTVVIGKDNLGARNEVVLNMKYDDLSRSILDELEAHETDAAIESTGIVLRIGIVDTKIL